MVVMMMRPRDVGIGVAILIGRSIGQAIGVIGPIVCIVTVIGVVRVKAQHRPGERAHCMDHTVRRRDGGLDDQQRDEGGGKHRHQPSQSIARPKTHQSPRSTTR